MINPVGCGIVRVLMEQGDALFMRTAISHGAVENLTANSTHRVRAIIQACDCGPSEKDGYHIKKVTGHNVNPMKWSSTDSKFKEI